MLENSNDLQDDSTIRKISEIDTLLKEIIFESRNRGKPYLSTRRDPLERAKMLFWSYEIADKLNHFGSNIELIGYYLWFNDRIMKHRIIKKGKNDDSKMEIDKKIKQLMESSTEKRSKIWKDLVPDEKKEILEFVRQTFKYTNELLKEESVGNKETREKSVESEFRELVTNKKSCDIQRLKKTFSEEILYIDAGYFSTLDIRKFAYGLVSLILMKDCKNPPYRKHPRIFHRAVERFFKMQEDDGSWVLPTRFSVDNPNKRDRTGLEPLAVLLYLSYEKEIYIYCDPRPHMKNIRLAYEWIKDRKDTIIEQPREAIFAIYTLLTYRYLLTSAILEKYKGKEYKELEQEHDDFYSGFYCEFLEFLDKADVNALILFGPPGSGKTFFTRQIAKKKRYNYISLDPSHFIREGWDRIETCAAKIFDDINALKKTVILLDEIEELFFKREDGDSRTSFSRFLTTSMLPKLQEVKERGTSTDNIVVVATNHIERIDQAVLRPGRFDFVIPYGPPDVLARLEMVFDKRGIKGDSVTKLKNAIFNHISRIQKDNSKFGERDKVFRDFIEAFPELLRDRNIDIQDKNIDIQEIKEIMKEIETNNPSIKNLLVLIDKSLYYDFPTLIKYVELRNDEMIAHNEGLYYKPPFRSHYQQFYKNIYTYSRLRFGGYDFSYLKYIFPPLIYGHEGGHA